jgi:hypothetical protein
MMLAKGAKYKEHAMSQILNAAITVVGIDIGKNSFHIVGHDERGVIVLRQRSRRPRNGCTTTCLQSHSPTSSPASPGVFSLVAEASR